MITTKYRAPCAKYQMANTTDTGISVIEVFVNPPLFLSFFFLLFPSPGTCASSLERKWEEKKKKVKKYGGGEWHYGSAKGIK